MKIKQCKWTGCLLALLLILAVCLSAVACSEAPQVPDGGTENEAPGGEAPGNEGSGGNEGGKLPGEGNDDSENGGDEENEAPNAPGGSEPGGADDPSNEEGDEGNEGNGGNEGNEGNEDNEGSTDMPPADGENQRPGGVVVFPGSSGIGEEQVKPTPDSTPGDSVHQHSYVTVEDVPHTCTENGRLVERCACGDERTTVRQTTGHHYENGICTVCGTVEGSLHQHVLQVLQEQLPTCVRSGFRDVKCEACAYQEYMILESEGHPYDGQGVCTACGYVLRHQCHFTEVSSTATCGESGERLLRCYGCGAEKTEAQPATGAHGVGFDTIGTCGICGARNGAFCAVCTWVFSYWESQPGCVTRGIGIYVCNGCAHTCRIPTSGTGHEYVGGVCDKCGAGEVHDCAEHLRVVYTDGSCDQMDVRISECTVCGAISSVEHPSSGHVLSPYECLCLTCGADLHAYTTVSVEGGESCRDLIRRHKKCDACGKETVEIREPQGHSIGDDGGCVRCDFTPFGPHDCDSELIHLVEADCSTFGWQLWRCRICDAVRWAQPAPREHRYDIIDVTVTASGFAAVQERCATCGAQRVSTGDAGPHAHVPLTVFEAAGAPGATRCVHCGTALPDQKESE